MMINRGAVCAVAVAAVLAAGACQPGSQTGTPPEAAAGRSTTAQQDTSGMPVGNDLHSPPPPAGSCPLRTAANGQPLPPVCTTGALNPNVTPDTIHQTICVSGWSTTTRKAEAPAGLFATWKKQMAAAENLPHEASEEDHLVAISLGGAPMNRANLWVEPGTVPNPKDKVEGDLQRAVCAGKAGLRAAQTAIASDWTTAEHRLGLTPQTGSAETDGE
jgi:hypothetical protein